MVEEKPIDYDYLLLFAEYLTNFCVCCFRKQNRTKEVQQEHTWQLGYLYETK